jgi:glucose-1-phosphate cytidylyltransferase
MPSLATLACVQARRDQGAPSTRYDLSSARFTQERFARAVRSYRAIEKPKQESGLINGGFFVLSPKVVDYIAGDSTLWELEPLEGLAAADQLMAFSHEGFWQPMDTLRDKATLEELWGKGAAPWKRW